MEDRSPRTEYLYLVAEAEQGCPSPRQALKGQRQPPPAIVLGLPVPVSGTEAAVVDKGTQGVDGFGPGPYLDVDG